MGPDQHQAVEVEDSDVSEKEAIKLAFLNKLLNMQVKLPGLATPNDFYQALAFTVRDLMLERWLSTGAQYSSESVRTVAYLSAEFLLGPHLGNNLINLGLYDVVEEAIAELGLDFDALIKEEEEPGLGNGGLGRLAACYLDSLATLERPALGYGIRYEYGIFYQSIVDGWQIENTDKWLRYGNPWEIHRAEWAVEVKIGGHTEQYTDDQRRLRVRWAPAKIVVGVPFDTPISGYRVNTINTLRLWRAEATESFDFSVFNRGDYLGAVSKKVTSENLTKVMYPNDQTLQGKELRLEQQYFFVSCSLQDMFRILKTQGLPLESFHEKFAVQLNDTHPAIGIAELMRILIDDYLVPWDRAWSVTTRTFSYTNHTLLPEALECWPLELFQRILPRHLEIIFEINTRFLNEVRIRFLGDESRTERLSLIAEGEGQSVRMAHLACVGSHRINGVAELHTALLKRDVLKDFHEMSPDKFINITNGVTPRRWLVLSNPRLAALISDSIGTAWKGDFSRIEEIAPFADDPGFRERWLAVKRANKADLADTLFKQTKISVDPSSMFDVMVKRFHEYKRQALAALHIVGLYRQLKSDSGAPIEARTFVFGGKAAPGYQMAKLIIKLITSVGEVVNRDPAVRGRLKVVFLPNFNVRYGQQVYPAAELSEQISTAGKEASGTGNMKFAMNGALTIGTMDGANIEIRDRVGADNFFLFGLTASEVEKRRADGYRPRDVYHSSPELKAVIDLIAGGFFSRGDPSIFEPLMRNLLEVDPYLVLADFDAYVSCQRRVSLAYTDNELWARSSILNTARSGQFSSDRSIRQYCDEIWNLKRLPITLLSESSARLEFIQ